MNIGIKKPDFKKNNLLHDKLNIHELIGIDDIKNGIVVTDNSYTAILEVIPINFKLKSEREQEYIINTYCELLKTMRISFDIRTISRKEDSRDHMEYISRLYETETNENVKALIAEYEETVSDILYQSAVRRRFLVYISYEAPAGIKFERINFRDAERWLNEKCAQFSEAIGKCGNKVIYQRDKNQLTAQIMFELLNIKSAEKERVPKI
ncbi:MAG: hypothetical protein PHE79_11630 [Eubacteriales bacterium]|nr:hypothetical protein [Eubacteriales bacterium]